MSIIVTISKGSPVILINQTVKFRSDFDVDVDQILWFIDGSLMSSSNGSSMEFRHEFSEPGRYEIKCRINNKFISKKIINVYLPPGTVLPEPEDTNIINLRFINRSDTAFPVDIITFQKNLAGAFDENIVAWRICSLNQDGEEDIVYDKRVQLGYDNPEVITTVNASVGNLYGLDNGVYFSGIWMSPSELATFNGNDYSITVKVYRSDKLLAIMPADQDDTSTFQFNPTIWVGVVSEVAEGDVLDSGTVSSINTEISLLGIKSADIVMTGGGVGPSAVPYSFSLENIVF